MAFVARATSSYSHLAMEMVAEQQGLVVEVAPGAAVVTLHSRRGTDRRGASGVSCRRGKESGKHAIDR